MARPSVFFGSMPFTACSITRSGCLAMASLKVSGLQARPGNRCGGSSVLVLGLVARHADLVRVDDDNEVAGVDMRGVLRLVLALEDVRGLHGDAAQNLVRRRRSRPIRAQLLGASRNTSSLSFLQIILHSAVRAQTRPPGSPLSTRPGDSLRGRAFPVVVRSAEAARRFSKVQVGRTVGFLRRHATRAWTPLSASPFSLHARGF